MESKVKIFGSAPQFVVKDVISTAEYYRDVLGFTEINYFMNPPVYAMVQRDGIQVHFGKADSDLFQTSNVPLRKVGFDMYFWVNDVKTLIEEFKANQANIVEPLTTRVYGNIEFAIKDCNGFKLTFGQEF